MRHSDPRFVEYQFRTLVLIYFRIQKVTIYITYFIAAAMYNNKNVTWWNSFYKSKYKVFICDMYGQIKNLSINVIAFPAAVWSRSAG